MPLITAFAFCLLFYTAIVVTILVLKKPPQTPDEAADAELRAQIMEKLNRITEDVKAIV